MSSREWSRISSMDGDGETGQESSSETIDSSVPRRKRGFYLTRVLPGCDAIKSPWCAIHDAVCDPCYRFIKALLTQEGFGKHTSETCGGNRVSSTRFRRGTVYPFYYHYSSLRMLKLSAKAGCNLCARILESPDLAERDRMVIAPVSSWRSFQKRSSRSSAFAFCGLRQMDTGTIQPTNRPFEFLLAKDEADSMDIPFGDALLAKGDDDEDFYGPSGEILNSMKYPSFHPCSKDCLDTIRQWRTECKEGHQQCQNQSTSLPLRLLDLRSVDEKDTRVVLVDTSDISTLSSMVKYVALSYCWGPKSEVTTTKENMMERKCGMSLELLPATLRDAIKICQMCDVRYLWVDALCICQNDEQEWAAEAANMANVYGGCEFALSALSSSTADDGFLKDRFCQPVSLGEVTVSYGTWHDTVQLFVRRQPWTLTDEFEHSPLSRRAWPLQERILAPAVLHFGRDQLIWECNTQHLKSETGEESDNADLVIRISDKGGIYALPEFRKIWDVIVESFTTRKLTYAKDRLVALAGMALKLRLNGVYCGRYVAGLWEEELGLQLLWHAGSRDSGLDLFDSENWEKYLQVPTWSWAHRNLPVHIFLSGEATSALDTKPTFHFLNSQSEEDSLHGNSVESCAIRLCGTIQRVADEAFYRDNHAVRAMGERHRRYPQLPGFESCWFLDEEPLAPDTYYCLRMAQDTDGIDVVIYYLLVRRVTNVTSVEYTKLGTVYQRIGVLELAQMTLEHLVKPYPDVYCKDGQLLLTDGSVDEIILI